MQFSETTFDEVYYGRYIGSKLYNYILSRGITLTGLEKIIGMKQPHISTLLNGKRTTKNLEQYRSIARGAGMLEEDFDKLVLEAKRAEYEHTTGMSLDGLPRVDLMAVLSRDFGIKDEAALKDIKKYIEFTKSQRKE